jgi:hypothetical protein
MSSTDKHKPFHRVPQLSFVEIDWPDGPELRRRLHDLQRHHLPETPGAQPLRIGVEDACGDLAHVIETTRLTEAVKVFETLADFGLVPGHGRCRASDGRTLVRTYRPRGAVAQQR